MSISDAERDREDEAIALIEAQGIEHLYTYTPDGETDRRFVFVGDRILRGLNELERYAQRGAGAMTTEIPAIITTTNGKQVEVTLVLYQTIETDYVFGIDEGDALELREVTGTEGAKLMLVDLDGLSIVLGSSRLRKLMDDGYIRKLADTVVE